MFRSVLLRLILIALSLTACAFSVLRINTIRQFSSISAPTESKPKAKTQEKDNSSDLVKLEHFIEDPFASFDERSKIAVKFSDLAGKEKDPEKRITYLCKTLNALSSSIRQEPMRARTLVTWANVKQLLGSYKCDGDVSDGFEAALDLALRADPLDQQALFNAGLVFLWAGNKERAYPIFRRVLELGTDSSSFQREFIYSLVSDGSSLQALIPAKLPQAIEYVRYLLNQNESKYFNLIFRQALWNFQVEALREFALRFENGEIDAALYLDRLFDLWKLSKESAVTASIDKLLADYYLRHGPEDLGAFFSSRSHFSELEIVSGLKLADSRPEKSALAYWDFKGEVALDEFFSSVGFYLPRDTTLRRLELHSNSRSDTQMTGLLRVLQSDDNTTWEDVTGVCTLYQIALPGRYVTYIDLPGSSKRFWKVHYASPGRNHQYKGGLSAMVRAFGVGSLKG